MTPKLQGNFTLAKKMAPKQSSLDKKMTPMPMDKSDYYKVLDGLEKVRSQLISTNPRNPGLRKISTELIKIMERVVQYRDVLLGDNKKNVT